MEAVRTVSYNPGRTPTPTQVGCALDRLETVTIATS